MGISGLQKLLQKYSDQQAESVSLEHITTIVR